MKDREAAGCCSSGECCGEEPVAVAPPCCGGCGVEVEHRVEVYLPCHYCDTVCPEDQEHRAYREHLREAHHITKHNEELLKVTLKMQDIEMAKLKQLAAATVESKRACSKQAWLPGCLAEPQQGELKSVPVFDPKLNFWYHGTPPVLEEVLKTSDSQSPQLPQSKAADDLVFDPKLNFWYSKKQEDKKEASPDVDVEAKAEAIRQKMEKEGKAIVEAEEAKAKADKEAAANAAASVYDQMKLKALEDAKVEAAAKLKAANEAKEAKVMEDLIRKKEEIESKLGKVKPKQAEANEVLAEAAIMGQRQLAQKKKDQMEKGLHDVELKAADVMPVADERKPKEELSTKPIVVQIKGDFGLPMTETSDDWMIDDDVGFMEDDDEEELITEITQTAKAETASKETKAEPEKKAFALPMTEASEDWMLDDEIGVMDDEDEETKEVETVPKETKAEPEKKAFALPMTEASDDWMLDDDIGVMVDEDEETKEVETAPTETKAEPEKKAFALPMTEASEDWMLDDDIVPMEDDEPAPSVDVVPEEAKHVPAPVEENSKTKAEEMEPVEEKLLKVEETVAKVEKKQKKSKGKKK